VKLVCQGLTNREIANRLFISVGTVKDHNYTVFQKAGVRNRTQLAQLFTQPTAVRDRAREQARASLTIRRVI
jgi:DNA-binding NarL/FixJ family response regulator